MRISSFFIYISAAVLGFAAALEREQQQSFLRRPNRISNQNEHHSVEARELEPGLFSISVSTPANQFNDKSRRLRPETPQYRSCVLYLEDLYYHEKDEKDVEEKWVCVIKNYVSPYGNIASPRAFYISGGGERFERFLESEAVSAYHVLHWNDAGAISLNESDDNDNMLILNSDITDSLWIGTIQDVENSDEESNGRRLSSEVATKGTKKTLVIRIVGDGVAPSLSLVQIREQVFGSGTSLKSQIESCSHGQLLIEPFSGATSGGSFNQAIQGGVVEIGLQTNPYGKNDKKMENDAMYAASYVFGNLEDQFDLVLFVMPPGISPAFAAYAYVRTPYSFYSNDKIESAMILMHEVGHNLGLEHSGQGSQQYGDSSGYMGYSNIADPKMCFNAVNNYQLDWYSKLSIKPTSDDGYGGTFYVSGVDGYDPNDTTKFVTLRLEQESMASDYYVGYNKAEGINSETQQDRDKVIIFTKDGGVNDSVNSWKKASLQVGESYVIHDFDHSGRSVTVTFTDVESNTAVVEIIPETSESPTISPMPTNSPTESPTFSPTSSPSSSPTSSPTLSPTVAPTASPSAAPTVQETVTTTFITTAEATVVTTYEGTKINGTATETERSSPYIIGNEALLATNETANTTSSNATVSNVTICDEELFLNINLRTDIFPEETWWILKMIGGDEIDRTSPATYQTPFENHTYSYCLEYDSCYLFKIFDTSEDGMGFVGDTASAPGYYEAYLGSERRFRKEGTWGAKKIHKFCTPAMDLGNETDYDLDFGNETDILFDEFEA